MLKIKDSVDLKELEKFGFEGTNYLYGATIYDTPISLMEDNADKPCLRIRSYTREIETYDNINLDNADINLLYDLIKADLVEKVGDSNER